MSYAKLGMAAFGAAAAYGLSRGRGRRGMHYDSAANEAWVAFFSADHPTDEGMRLGRKFRDRIEYLVDNKFKLPDEASYPDLDTLAYLSYASHAGHGIGLWEADEPWHPAFEKVVMADKQARDLGYRLDEEVYEGKIAAGEVDLEDYEGSSARGRRARPDSGGRCGPNEVFVYGYDVRRKGVRGRYRVYPHCRKKPARGRRAKTEVKIGYAYPGPKPPAGWRKLMEGTFAKDNPDGSFDTVTYYWLNSDWRRMTNRVGQDPVDHGFFATFQEAIDAPKGRSARGRRSEGGHGPELWTYEVVPITPKQWVEQTMTADHRSHKARWKGKSVSASVGEARALADARKTGKLTAYLSGNGKAVTGWLGNPYSSRIALFSTYRDNFGGERTPLRFVAPWDNNKIWSGYAMGRGMYGHFKRTKIKDLWS